MASIIVSLILPTMMMIVLLAPFKSTVSTTNDNGLTSARTMEAFAQENDGILNGSDANTSSTRRIGRQGDGVNSSNKPVFLYRGPNQPSQPYFYLKPAGQTTQNSSNKNQLRSQTTQLQQSKTKTTTTTITNNDHYMEQSDLEDQTRSETRGRSMRIRYDGEPFESIESLREVQGHRDLQSGLPYPEALRRPLQGSKYDTLPGGIFSEEVVDDDNRRYSSSVLQRQIRPNYKTDQGRRPEMIMSIQRRIKDEDGKQTFIYDRSRRRGPKKDEPRPTITTTTTKKLSIQRSNPSRRTPLAAQIIPETKIASARNRPTPSSAPMDNHYDDGGGYDHERPGSITIMQNAYGNEFDYESYELAANRGPYGNRITSRNAIIPDASAAFSRNNRLSTDRPRNYALERVATQQSNYGRGIDGDVDHRPINQSTSNKWPLTTHSPYDFDYDFEDYERPEPAMTIRPPKAPATNRAFSRHTAKAKT